MKSGSFLNRFTPLLTREGTKPLLKRTLLDLAPHDFIMPDVIGTALEGSLGRRGQRQRCVDTPVCGAPSWVSALLRKVQRSLLDRQR